MTTIERVEAALRAQRIETPSWAFGNSGTRFAVFPQAGVPRNTHEKIEDAAQVHRYTGVAPSVALHIPWDTVDDYAELREFAAALGLSLGAINPNLFQEPEYKLGSFCNPDEHVRRRFDRPSARVHRDRRRRPAPTRSRSGLPTAPTTPARTRSPPAASGSSPRCRRSTRRCRSGIELLVEYKLYEPAFYATDLADWGSALTLCQELGPSARVLVDLGHHAQGVNIEQIVSLLQRLNRLGGFHFNDRKYGDDDLMVGSIDPFQLFRIFDELVSSGAVESGVRLTIDQSHNIEPKIEALIQSVLTLQESYAKALLVDRAALEQAQLEGDVLAANRILLDAFATDVRPLCAKVRLDLGAAEDPIAAFRAGGYAAAVAESRAGGAQAGWQ